MMIGINRELEERIKL